MRRVPRSLDLIGQGSPRLRHAKQRSLGPGVLKLGSHLEAVGGAPPVERYKFAGRHPHPKYVFFTKAEGRQFVPRPKEKTRRESSTGENSLAWWGMAGMQKTSRLTSGRPQSHTLVGTPGAHATN